MKRASSYTAMATGGGGWFESWTDRGQIKVWLHPEPPLTRNLHSIRQVKIDEDDRGVSKKIVWLPWVCHEDEHFHQLMRAKKNPEPTTCPMCMLIDHLRQRDDVQLDDVIFELRAGKETYVITRGEFLGEVKDAWKDVALAKGDYLINAIGVDAPEEGAKILQAKYQLVKELQKVIVEEVGELGDEGNPEKTPRAYRFTFDKTNSRYGVMPYERAKVTDAVTDAWNGPAPDSDRFGEPGDPVLLLQIFRDHLMVADVPYEEWFAPLIEEHSKKKKDEAPAPKAEERPRAAQRSAAPARTTARTREDDKPAREGRAQASAQNARANAPSKPINSRDDGRDIDPPDAPLGGKKSAATKAPARATKKPVKEPEPEEYGADCGDCGYDKVPVNAKACPECHAEFEDEGAES